MKTNRLLLKAMQRKIHIALMVGIILASVFVVPAHAGNYVVGGNCTETEFNAALANIDTDEGGTITFDCGPNPKLIILTNDKWINWPTTIDGGGKIALDGGSTTRLFRAQMGFDEGWPLVLKNITLQNGKDAGNGGAVYIDNYRVVLMENVMIRNSFAMADGGAIYVDYHGYLNLKNVVLSSNTANEEGGAVYNNQGTLDFANVLFDLNWADGWGGGLNNDQGTATITGSTFTQNQAGVPEGGTVCGTGGGGIDSYNGSLTVIDSFFDRNISQNGGGGLRLAGGGSASLTNVTLSGNKAGAIGGGIANCGSPVVALTNVTLNGNEANIWGGGGIFHLSGNMTLTNVTLSSNQSYQEGGGIDNYSTLSIAKSTFSDNSAGNGGGICNRGTVSIMNSTFSGNVGDTFGGGLSNLGAATATITNTTFSANSAPPSYGGGIYNIGTMVALRNTIVANSTGGGNCSGTITNNSNNIDDGTTCGWGSANGSMSGTDPWLGSLRNNGGPTKTHFPSPYSPAIDHGTNTGCPATDQRGVPRPHGAACDIGAVEAVYLLYLPLVRR